MGEQLSIQEVDEQLFVHLDQPLGGAALGDIVSL
jgi:hypothetical protein